MFPETTRHFQTFYTQHYSLIFNFFFSCISGKDNPLTEDVESFTHLNIKEKMTIVKALCETIIVRKF